MIDSHLPQKHGGPAAAPRPCPTLLLIARVQAALDLACAAPAAGALVLAEHHGPRAGPAADARVALIVQRVVRNVFVGDQLPDILLRPVRQRADLHEAELLVPA